MCDVTTRAIGSLRELLPLEFPPALPVYVLGRYEVPPEYSELAEDCGAFTSTWLDVRMRSVLESRGLWQGRGFAVIVCQLGLFYADPVESRPDTLLRVLLHEAAHRFDKPDTVLHRPVDEWPEKLLFFADPPPPVAPGEQPTTSPTVDRREPWHCHEWPFIRSAIHIQRRAASRGFETPINSLCIADKFYGLSPATEYAKALGDEPERLADVHLWDVMRTDCPAPFLELFEADCERWKSAGSGPAGETRSSMVGRSGAEGET